MWMSIVSGLFASAKATDELAPENLAEQGENIPGINTPLPSPEQLLEMLDSMTGISEEDKASLREELMKNIEGQVSDFQQMSGSNDLTSQTVILLSLLALIVLIFVFFVYKLFRCLKEREHKRNEKKKTKQLKKKK